MRASVSTGGSARLQIHVDDHGITGLVQQLLFDQIHMGDLGHLLLDVAVILDIDAAFGDHGGNGLGVVGIGLGHGQADISPFHKKEPPWVLCFLFISIVPDSGAGCKRFGEKEQKKSFFKILL